MVLFNQFMRLLKGITALSVVALFGGLVVANSLAASVSQANGFVVSPVSTEITVNKGQSEIIQLSVQNPTAQTVAVKAVINDFVANSNESGSPQLILNNNSPLPKNNFESLVAPISTLTLGPQARDYISVTISVPENALSGGYYGAIRFLPAVTSNTSNVGLTASVGSIFLITVPGNLIEKLNLIQLSAADNNGTPSSFMTTGSVNVLTRLQNSGNIQLQPYGSAIIKDIFGHVVEQYQFNEVLPRANVLPDSIRKFIVPLSHRHWFGRYTIEETVAYQQGTGNFITSTAKFYYFPLWFLLSLLVLIVAIAVWAYWLVTRHRASRSQRK
jgi:hypothetical protein